jgi:hypothetical protein
MKKQERLLRILGLAILIPLAITIFGFLLKWGTVGMWCERGHHYHILNDTGAELGGCLMVAIPLYISLYIWTPLKVYYDMKKQGYYENEK